MSMSGIDVVPVDQSSADLWVQRVVSHARGSITAYKHGAPTVHAAANLVALAASASAGLASLGIGRGDHVALLCSDGPEWIAADIAVQSLGAISVCLDPLLVDRVQWRDQELRALVVDHLETAERIGFEGAIVLLGPEPSQRPSVVRWRDLIAAAPSDALEQLDRRVAGLAFDDPATMVWEPAELLQTTRPPAAKTLTHGDVLGLVRAWEREIEPGAGDVCTSMLPLSFLSGRITAEMMPLAAGCTGVTYPGRTWRSLPRVRATVLVAPAGLWGVIAESVEGKVGELKPTDEPAWSLRMGLMSLAVLLIVVGFFAGSAFDAAAAVAAIGTAGVAVARGRDAVPRLAWIPGVLAAVFLLLDGAGGGAWAQLFRFLFCLSALWACAAAVARRLKWWNAQLWLDHRTGRVRTVLWERPARTWLGLERVRVTISTPTPVPNAWWPHWPALASPSEPSIRRPDMGQFLQFLVSGLAIGGVNALVALGLVVLFQPTKVLSFAQGSLVSLAGVVIWLLTARLSIFASLPVAPRFLVSIAIAIIAVGGLGVLFQYTVVNRAIGQPIFSLAILTIGLATVIDTAVNAKLPSTINTVDSPLSNGVQHIAGTAIANSELWTIAIVAVLLGVFFSFYRFTKIGLAIRAAAIDTEAAAVLGISLPRLFALAWAISGVFAVAAAAVILSGLARRSPPI